MWMYDDCSDIYSLRQAQAHATTVSDTILLVKLLQGITGRKMRQIQSNMVHEKLSSCLQKDLIHETPGSSTIRNMHILPDEVN